MIDPLFKRSTILRLVDAAVGEVEARAASHDDLSRRQVLAAVARTTGTALAAAYGASLLAACGSSGPRSAQTLLRSAQRRNESVERWLFRHTSMNAPTAGIAGGAFPTYHVAPAVPLWDAASNGPWTLAVTGLVTHPLRLTLDELQRLPRVTQRVEHFCVEGWDAVATWHGVRVRDLAALAGAKVSGADAAPYVDFLSFDVEKPGAPSDDAKRGPAGTQSQLVADAAAGRGYHECWDLPSAMHPQTLVAYGMDGALLGAAHGAPARVHSPVKLGYKNTKYLTQIVFRAERTGGYWSDEGYEWYGGT